MYLQVLPQFQTPRFKHLLIIGRKATFSFFSPRLWLIFFLLVFYYLWAWWRKIIFFFLALCCLFLLIEEVCGFLIPSLLTYHMSYLQLYRFCLALMLRLTTGEITFTLYWSASTDLVTLFIYCTEYILLDNISYSLLVVKARQFRFANKIESGWTIGLPAD